MLKQNIFPIAYIGWMVFVTWSSLFSFSGDDLPVFQIPHLDKLVHFTFYFVAVILGTMAIRGKKAEKISLGKSLLVMVVAMIFFGILIEVIQGVYTLDRMGDKYDALANSIGAVSGALVLKFVFSDSCRLKWKQ